jgi:hypothetical protein
VDPVRADLSGCRACCVSVSVEVARRALSSQRRRRRSNIRKIVAAAHISFLADFCNKICQVRGST